MSDTPVGQLIDIYYRLREERNEIKAQEKELTRKMETLKLEIIQRLQDHKLEGGRGKVATGSINEIIVPTIKNYDALVRFIYRHKKIHLLERRVSSGPFREELKERGEVPGLEPFTRINLNVQKRS
jgi:hypothetical protein